MIIQKSDSAALISQIGYQARESRQNVAEVRNDVADKVTISEAARMMAENGANRDPGRNSRILELARSDEGLARELLDGYTYGLDQPLHDISNFNLKTGTGLVYAATGQAVTSKTEQYFSDHTIKLKGEKIALINAEREKGTSSAEILEKVFSLIEKQPEAYKAMINWEMVSS